MAFLTTQQDNLPAGVSGGGGQAYTRQTQAGEMAGVQLDQLLTSSNPLIENAQRRGQEFAQTRRLGNSSIAAGAAERSAIEAATPFALQQAGAVGQAATENLGFLNQYEMNDRSNQSAEVRAQIGADATKYAADASASAQRYSAKAQLQAVEAQLSHAGQQADMNRMHQIVMSNLTQDQTLAQMAAAHDINLDSLEANAFYELQQMAAVDNINVRNQGMSFVMGAYNNYTTMMQDAMMGDFDSAAFGRLVQSATNYLDSSIGFGSNLFQNFPEFEFELDSFTGGG